MKEKLKIGICGFPVSRKRIFASVDAVEVQQTFYDPPKDETLKKWVSEAPSGFTFTVKAWQLITHPPSSPTYKRLKSLTVDKGSNCGFFSDTELVRKAVEITFNCARILRANIILFQTPASFKAEEANVKTAVKFFKKYAKSGFTFAFEPRKWDVKRAMEVAEKSGVSIVFDPLSVKSDELSIFLSQPLVYVRLHGIGGYKYRYSRGELEKILSSLSDARGPVYIMFNNVYMLDNALEMKEILEKGS